MHFLIVDESPELRTELGIMLCAHWPDADIDLFDPAERDAWRAALRKGGVSALLLQAPFPGEDVAALISNLCRDPQAPPLLLLADQVVRLAALARESGVDGVVCSPHEIAVIRREFGGDFLVVTPGIRPAWAAAQDQKRIMTPAEAVGKGADYLVIGRPVTAAPSPREAFALIAREIAQNSPRS